MKEIIYREVDWGFLFIAYSTRNRKSILKNAILRIPPAAYPPNTLLPLFEGHKIFSALFLGHFDFFLILIKSYRLAETFKVYLLIPIIFWTKYESAIKVVVLSNSISFSTWRQKQEDELVSEANSIFEHVFLENVFENIWEAQFLVPVTDGKTTSSFQITLPISSFLTPVVMFQFSRKYTEKNLTHSI